MNEHWFVGELENDYPTYDTDMARSNWKMALGTLSNRSSLYAILDPNRNMDTLLVCTQIVKRPNYGIAGQRIPIHYNVFEITTFRSFTVQVPPSASRRLYKHFFLGPILTDGVCSIGYVRELPTVWIQTLTYPSSKRRSKGHFD